MVFSFLAIYGCIEKDHKETVSTPDWFRIKEHAIKRHPEQDGLNIPANRWIKILPGLLLAVGVTLISLFLSKILGNLLPFEKNPVSPLLVTILIGLLIRNLFPLPDIMKPGINFGIKKILRFGIVLLGIRLSLGMYWRLEFWLWEWFLSASPERCW